MKHTSALAMNIGVIYRRKMCKVSYNNIDR